MRSLASLPKQFLSPPNQLQSQSCSFGYVPQFLSSSSSQSQYRKQTLLANVLHKFGFPVSELPSLLSKNQFLLNSDVSEVEKCLGILLFSFKLPQNVVVALTFSCPAVLRLEFLKQWEAAILESGTLGKSPLLVRSVIEFSKKFQIDPGKFLSCIQVFKDLQFTDDTISRILCECPKVMVVDERELKKHISIFTSMGLRIDEINRIYLLCPQIFGFGIEQRLKPLLDEFSQMGFGRRLLRQEIVCEPRLLTLELGELQRCLGLLEKLKCRESIKEEIFSMGELKAGFAVKLRVDLLCRYGLIRRDALNLLRREPRTITYEIEDIKKKIEFLLQTMKYEIGCLVEVPEYLGVNFDKQILPRYNVIEYLRSRGGLGFEVRLRDIIKPSRLKFYNFFVKPYPECEKMFGRFSIAEAKSRHPSGVWRLFKPPPVPLSKEEANNIRDFMEQRPECQMHWPLVKVKS